jgi:CcmD family protein
VKRTVLLIVLVALLPGAILMARQAARPGTAPADPTSPTTAGQPTTTQALPQDFVPVKAMPEQAEQLPAAPFLVGAYAFIWVALLVYVWFLWKRMTTLERELADLRRRVQKQ